MKWKLMLLVTAVMVLFVGFSLNTESVLDKKEVKVEDASIENTEDIEKKQKNKVKVASPKVVGKSENDSLNKQKMKSISNSQNIQSKKSGKDKVLKKSSEKVTPSKSVSKNDKLVIFDGSGIVGGSLSSTTKVSKNNVSSGANTSPKTDLEEGSNLVDEMITPEVKPVETEKKPLDKPEVEVTEEKESPVITVKTETSNEAILFETIKEEDATLEKGKTKVKQAGKNGNTAITYEVTYQDGKEVSRVETDRKVSAPTNELIFVGTKEAPVEPVITVKTETKNQVISFKTVKQDDPTLEKGKTKIKQAGKNGNTAITYEVTYKDGKEVSRVETDRKVSASTNELIFVGTKEAPVEPVITVKTETSNEAILFETIKEEDSTLEKGKIKVKQEGKNGNTIVTYTVTYQDGKEIERKETEREVSVQPVNKIVLVGTMITEVKEESKVIDIPFKTVKQDDPTLEKGQTKVKQAGKNGTETISYKITYVNGKETSRVETGRTTIEPINQIVLIGTKEAPVISNKEELISLINTERKKNGLSPLKNHAKLGELAQLKSEDISNLGYWSHYSPTYGYAQDMAKANGISHIAVAEVLTKYSSKPLGAFNAWMDSINHKDVLLDGDYTHIGVGYSTKDHVWTVMVLYDWD